MIWHKTVHWVISVNWREITLHNVIVHIHIENFVTNVTISSECVFINFKPYTCTQTSKHSHIYAAKLTCLYKTEQKHIREWPITLLFIIIAESNACGYLHIINCKYNTKFIDSNLKIFYWTLSICESSIQRCLYFNHTQTHMIYMYVFHITYIHTYTLSIMIYNCVILIFITFKINFDLIKLSSVRAFTGAKHDSKQILFSVVLLYLFLIYLLQIRIYNKTQTKC